jgi:hypothetical protein
MGYVAPPVLPDTPDLSLAPAPADPMRAFQPSAGREQWWTGDPASLPYHEAGVFHRHIISRKAVLSPAQCRVLIDCFERRCGELAPEDPDPFWSGRFIWQNALPPEEVDAARIMQQVRFLSLTLLNQAVRLPRALYGDTAQIVRWPPGTQLSPHADNIHPDGQPNTTPHRSFSSILYLNDDYEGGETYFPGHGVRLKPEAGALVLFGAGPEYVHGVSNVTRGMRYTYAGWFTFDKAWEAVDAAAV